MTAIPTRVKQLLRAPEKILTDYNLVYVNDADFLISRKKRGRGFGYDLAGKRITDKTELKRIKRLAIPPMWNEVKVTHVKEGHLQAYGRDDKKRKQYRYHPTWIKIRQQTKFYKMVSFGNQLPSIREKVDQDLDQKGWPKSKVIALVIRLMEETHIRIGNAQYAKRNKTYGLTTLRKRHVALHRDRIKFQFIGKKGKAHEVTIRNKKLIRLVSRCEEIPGWELFKYYDENGQKQTLESSMINTYLQQISADFFSAKDFRTWAGSVVFFETLLPLGTPATAKERHVNVLAGFDQAAKALGNTRNVCKKYYVHPLLVSSYEEGTLDPYLVQANNSTTDQPYFTKTEAIMLQFITQHSPAF